MYNKTIWVNDSAPFVDSTNLNKIEQGLLDAHNTLDFLETWNLWLTKDSSDDNTTLVAFDRIFADTSVSSFTLLLPNTPNIGDKIQFTDVANSFGANSLIIDGNGSNIIGNTTLELDINSSSIILTYSGATYGWVITST